MPIGTASAPSGREGRCCRHRASGVGDAVRLGRVWCKALTVTQGEGEPNLSGCWSGSGPSEDCRGGKRRRRKD